MPSALSNRSRGFFIAVIHHQSIVNKLYSQVYSQLSYRYNSPYSIEIDYQIANYSIWLYDSLGKYSVAIYVGNTAIYAHCDSENQNEIDKILDAIDYLKP